MAALFDIDEETEKKAEGWNCGYSWSDMANALSDCGVPHEVIRNLADVPMAIIRRRPILDLFKFDEYLHSKYGMYENEGKSMRDMFKEIFKEKADKIAYYFGVGGEK